MLKKIHDTLEVTHEGTDQVKESRIKILFINMSNIRWMILRPFLRYIHDLLLVGIYLTELINRIL